MSEYNLTGLVDSITEDEALSLFYSLSTRFGWTGTMFGRGDAESEWAGDDDTEMTDEQWQAVQDNYYWRKGLPEVLVERGWDLIKEAVREVKGEQ